MATDEPPNEALLAPLVSTLSDPLVPQVAAAVGRVYLIVRHGVSTTVIEVGPGDTLVIGRSPEADIVLDEPRVSRKHAVLKRQGDEVMVSDVGSRNATAVNGALLDGRERVLIAGDLLQVGSVEIAVAIVRDWVETRGAAETSAIVADPVMVDLYARVRRVAAAPTSVLILGETGAGKEIIAEHIHRWSPRAAGPFVCLNCASLPDTLLESELFGHEKGAFTGAASRKAGYFEVADGGTLFFDEVGELPLAMQAKLLRALETRMITPVGGTQPRPVDVRVVAATHHDLEAESAAGRFRPDLFYRLNGFTLLVPALRERPTELVLLAELFARRFAETLRAPPPVFSDGARALLARYLWPGNVRELKNAIEQAILSADHGVLMPEHFPPAMRRVSTAPPPPRAESDDEGMRERVAEVERASIEAALRAEDGNVTQTAVRLGVSRGSLLHKLKKYGLKPR
jgi:two-component system, NtrC family, response regulator AtoC